MSLVTVERIKLFSTRSPWWCMVLALVLADGFVTLGFIFAPDDTVWRPADAVSTYQFGLMVMMVMATLAVTTEYRFGTIRTSFLSVPKRIPILLSKALVAATLSAVVGLVAAFGALGLGTVLVSDADLALTTGAEWRAVLGVALVYFLAALIAIAIGTLIRQSAGAIAVVICWPLLIEGIGQTIPKVGDFLADWGPFNRASWFILGNQGTTDGTADASDAVMSPTWSLIYFAAWAIGLLVISLVVAKKRDA
ncbi:ABC transporter permease subunit [Kribbella catacumbae]|uniref:ABC transporter permease subunit n=1 Tax=Kribbella catacumbae TaxID=460086 RepID=UPI0003784376|nr:ABC transporter permease [Kribbella catacumbae]